MPRTLTGGALSFYSQRAAIARIFYQAETLVFTEECGNVKTTLIPLKRVGRGDDTGWDQRAAVWTAACLTPSSSNDDYLKFRGKGGGCFFFL